VAPEDGVRGGASALDLLVGELESRSVGETFLRELSRLEGWTNAHVLAHIAGTADGYRRMVEGLMRGEQVDMYPRGMAGRNAEIAADADQPIDGLITHLVESDAALNDAYARLGEGAWSSAVRRWGDQPWPAFDVPFMRWREVAVHSTDLNWELTMADAWSEEFVAHEFRRQLAALSARLTARQIVSIEVLGSSEQTLVVNAAPDEPAAFAVVRGTAVDLLAWMLGRGDGEPRWPRLSAWAGVP
jgi:maleylpyruvate isomerase